MSTLPGPLARAEWLVGAADVAVYDGSLREWARDPERAAITGKRRL